MGNMLREVTSPLHQELRHTDTFLTVCFWCQRASHRPCHMLVVLIQCNEDWPFCTLPCAQQVRIWNLYKTAARHDCDHHVYVHCSQCLHHGQCDKWSISDMLTWLLSLTHLNLQNNIHNTSQSAQTADQIQHYAKFISVLYTKTHAWAASLLFCDCRIFTSFVGLLCYSRSACSCCLWSNQANMLIPQKTPHKGWSICS